MDDTCLLFGTESIFSIAWINPRVETNSQEGGIEFSNESKLIQ